MSVPSEPAGRFADRRGQRSPLIAVAALLILGLGLLAIIVQRGPLEVDVAALTALQHPDGAWAATLAVFNLAGQTLIWDPVVIVIAIVLALRGRRRDGLILVAALLIAETVATGLKLLIDRTRPPGSPIFDLITQASFPSGHVTRTVVTLGLLVAMAWGRASLRIPTLAFAVAASVLMGLARVASGEHWFTDVVGAAFLGLLVLVVVALIVPVIEGASRQWIRGRPRQP